MSAESMVMGSLLADALCLGPHWIYDPQEIVRSLGRPDRFHDPISKYHPGKAAGDLTHYGDQVLFLLRHLAEAGRFVPEDYAAAWRKHWEDPATIGYRDGATKGTLANLAAGMPSLDAGVDSHDIAGAAVISPLFLLRWRDDEELVNVCGAFTGMTHRDPDVMKAAEFFARVMLASSRGKTIPEAIESVGAALPDGNLAQWLAAAKGSARSSEKDITVLAEHGLSCNIDGGFAGVCHLLLRHPEDPVTALVENAAAGGDSSARGMIAGMVYGAAGFLDKLPASWTDGLNSAGEVRRLCAAIAPGISN